MSEAKRPSPHPTGMDRRTVLRGMSGILGGLVAGAALSACGGNESGDGGQSSPGGSSGGAPSPSGGASSPGGQSSASPNPSSGAAEPTPQSGGALSIATGDGLSHDLFVGNSFGPQQYSLVQCAWPLYRYQPGTFDIAPGLAEGYEVSPDGMVHTMKLRSGLTFHDGSSLTAEEVIANLKAAFNEDDPLRGPGGYTMVPVFWSGDPSSFIDSLAAPDDQTIEITLKQARADLRGPSAFLPILNPKVLSEKDWGTNVDLLKKAGSGPFRVEQFSPNEFVEYSKVDGFVEEAYLDKLRLQLIPDASARFLALKGNQVQAAIGLSKADWNASANDPTYRTHIGNKGNNFFLAINGQSGNALATNQKLRQALVMAMNREGYIQSFWGDGLADAADVITLTPGMPGYPDDITPVPYDPEQAKKLIAETGLSAEELHFGVVSPPSFAGAPELRTLLSALAGDWKKVGVTLDVNITDGAGWQADHTTDTKTEPFGCSGGNSVSVAGLYFNNPIIINSDSYSSQIAEARVAPTADEQAAALEKLLTQAAEEVAGIPLAYTAPAALSLAEVHDIAITAAPVDPQNRAWIEQ